MWVSKALALPDTHVFEQGGEFARLRSPVLFRGLDLRAQGRSGMPWPARIIEHGAGQRDCVCIAVLQYLFGLLRFGDQTDGYGGQAGLCLDPRGKGHLKSGADRYLLLGRNASG